MGLQEQERGAPGSPRNHAQAERLWRSSSDPACGRLWPPRTRKASPVLRVYRSAPRRIGALRRDSMTSPLRANVLRCWSLLDRRALALSTPTLHRIIFFGLMPAVLSEPLLSLLGLWGFAVWFVPRAYQHRAEAFRIQELNRKRIRRLERAVEEIPAAHTCPAPFRRVGLCINVPLHVAQAARRSFRSKLHPDGHPEHRKPEATRRFQECDSLFEQVWTLRGFTAPGTDDGAAGA